MKYECYYNGCASSFNSKYNLKRHINSKHLGLRKFSCNVCGKTLASKQNLREHEYIHLDIKPFACDFVGCKKSYRQSSQLSIHRKTHKSSRNLDHMTSLIRELKYGSNIQLPPISNERSEAQKSIPKLESFLK